MVAVEKFCFGANIMRMAHCGRARRRVPVDLIIEREGRDEYLRRART
jgi:hypothetical protein